MPPGYVQYPPEFGVDIVVNTCHYHYYDGRNCGVAGSVPYTYDVVGPLVYGTSRVGAYFTQYWVYHVHYDCYVPDN